MEDWWNVWMVRMMHGLMGECGIDGYPDVWRSRSMMNHWMNDCLNAWINCRMDYRMIYGCLMRR